MKNALSEILNHPSDLLAVLDAASLRIIQANTLFCKHFGVGPADVCKKHPFELAGIFQEGIDKKIFHRLDENGVYCDTTTDKDRDYSFSRITLKNEALVLLRIIARQPEADLHENEERMQLLSRVSLESILFLQNDVIVNCNDQFAKLFGHHSWADVVGKRAAVFFNAADLQRLKKTAEIGGNNKAEIQTHNRQGDAMVLEVTGTGIRYHKKPALALLIYDITARKRAYLAHEQSLVRYRNLLENSPYAVFILTNGVIRYLNYAASNLVGYDDEDALYEQRLSPFFLDAQREEVERDFEQILHGEEVAYKEVRIRDRPGNEVDVGIKATLTIYENKPSIQVTMNNISTRMQLMQEQVRARLAEEINNVLKKEIEEHKETQEKLEAAQRYSRNIIESSLDMIIACDRNDHIVEFNPAAVTEFGYAASDITGRSLELLFDSKESYEQVTQALRKDGRFSGEVGNRRRSGSVFTSLLSASLIRNERGEVLGSMGVSRDISVLRASQRKALEQGAKLESIYNSTENMMLWTINQAGEITSMNHNLESWMKSDYGESVSPGTPFLDTLKRHVDPDLYQGQLTHFEKAFNGQPKHFDLPLHDIKDRKVWLEIFINPVYLDDKLEEVSCLAFDISERKEIDKRVRDSLKEKEVLLQEVHHRVKNNLQVISSILNLQSSFVTDPHTLEILEESQSRIASMSYIHETLYRTADFSAIEFTGYIRTLSRNLVQTYKMQSAKVELKTDFPEIHLSIDQAIPCGLIVNELVSNALKHAFNGRKKGKIKVNLRETKGILELSVTDDGTGLPADFRFEDSPSLGIQLVYTLAEQLEAKVNVESAGGTRFVITFLRR